MNEKRQIKLKEWKGEKAAGRDGKADPDASTPAFTGAGCRRLDKRPSVQWLGLTHGIGEKKKIVKLWKGPKTHDFSPYINHSPELFTTILAKSGSMRYRCTPAEVPIFHSYQRNMRNRKQHISWRSSISRGGEASAQAIIWRDGDSWRPSEKWADTLPLRPLSFLLLDPVTLDHPIFQPLGAGISPCVCRSWVRDFHKG